MSVAAPPGWRVQCFEALGSTQDVALAAARAGDPGNLAILAERQSAGRGSRGRGWTSPPGNLSLSVLIRPGPGGGDMGRWALLAGIALHDALSVESAGLMLKWPNDLLLDGAKLGGMLIDATLDAAGACAWLVIGFGANLASAPAIPGRATACLAAPAPSAPDVAARVLAGLDRFRHIPLDALCAEWLGRAHPIGTHLDILTPSRRISGAFAGLSPTGALLLAGRDEPVSSGEVFLPGLELAVRQPHLPVMDETIPCS